MQPPMKRTRSGTTTCKVLSHDSCRTGGRDEGGMEVASRSATSTTVSQSCRQLNNVRLDSATSCQSHSAPRTQPAGEQRNPCIAHSSTNRPVLRSHASKPRGHKATSASSIAVPDPPHRRSSQGQVSTDAASGIAPRECCASDDLASSPQMSPAIAARDHASTLPTLTAANSTAADACPPPAAAGAARPPGELDVHRRAAGAAHCEMRGAAQVTAIGRHAEPAADAFQRAGLPTDVLMLIVQRCPFWTVIALSRRFRDLALSTVTSATAARGGSVGRVLSLLTRAPALRHVDLQQSSSGANVRAIARLPQVCSLTVHGSSADGLAALASLPSLRSLGLRNCRRLRSLMPLRLMTQLRELALESVSFVEDMEPLRNLTLLTLLDLGDISRRLPSLAPVGALTALRQLSIVGCRGCEVDDISPLSQLTLLTALMLSLNRVSVFTALQPLTALNTLLLGGYGVTGDDSALEQMTQLRHVTLRNFQDPDSCRGLARLEKLTDLHIVRWGQLRCINHLTRLSRLTALELMDCPQLQSLAPLRELTQLKALDVRECDKLTDLRPLSSLVELRDLVVEFCSGVSCLGALSGLSTLESLKIVGCENVTHLTALAPLRALREVSVFDCGNCRHLPQIMHAMTSVSKVTLVGCWRLDTIEPLAGLPALRSLHLSGCTSIPDMRHLAAFRALRELKVYACTQLTDLSGCSSLRQLRELHLHSLPLVSDFEQLRALTSLTAVSLADLDGLGSVDSVLRELPHLEKVYIDNQHVTLGQLQR